MMLNLIPSFKSLMTLGLGVCLLWGSAPSSVQAGCGCTKPPPELASVRPNATYAGTELTLFHASLQAGQDYTVTLTSGTQPGQSASVQVEAVIRRDVADGGVKPQLNIALPSLPLGPTSISVTDQNGPVLSLTDDAFTVVPQPIAIPSEVGESSLPNYQAAVSRNGVVYMSLDVSAVQHPRTFQAEALGYPMRFTNDEIVFYNIQGVMMQLLAEGMPGLYALEAATGTPDSDLLQYSRHEFNTHFLQHAELQPHGVDPSDPNWHTDGSLHIEHNYLIVAISGMLDDGSTPAAGATPAFELAMSSQSFFQHGLVSDVEMDIEDTSVVDSYNSKTGQYGMQGDILSNGELDVENSAEVYGNVAADNLDIEDTSLVDGDAISEDIAIDSGATVTGASISQTLFVDLLPVDVPDGLEDLGVVEVDDEDVYTLSPGSYLLSELTVKNEGTLEIDNADGPVTLYILGEVDFSHDGQVQFADPDPEKFAIYVAGGFEVDIDEYSQFSGVIYAPESLIEIEEDSEFYGAAVGHTVRVEQNAQVHYDTSLRGE